MSFSRDANGRLRAIWRLLLFVLVFTFAAVPIELVRRAIELRFPLTAALPKLSVDVICLTIAVLVATYVMLRFVEHRSWSMVMLDRSALEPRGLALGTITGLLPIGIPSALLFAIGWMSRESAPSGSWLASAIGVTIFLVPAAFVEELLVRGYPFAIIREAAGLWVAVACTGAVFGLLHAANPGATTQSIVVVTVSGVFLAITLVVTRSLYAATLSHAAWNWVMAVLLHTQVSGNWLPAPNYHIVDSGPDWATGGSWGPEGGIPATVAMLLLIPMLMKFGRYRLSASPDVRPVAIVNGAMMENANA